MNDHTLDDRDTALWFRKLEDDWPQVVRRSALAEGDNSADGMQLAFEEASPHPFAPEYPEIGSAPLTFEAALAPAPARPSPSTASPVAGLRAMETPSARPRVGDIEAAARSGRPEGPGWSVRAPRLATALPNADRVDTTAARPPAGGRPMRVEQSPVRARSAPDAVARAGGHALRLVRFALVAILLAVAAFAFAQWVSALSHSQHAVSAAATVAAPDTVTRPATILQLFDVP